MDELPRERFVEWGVDALAAACLAGALAFAWLNLMGGGAGGAAVGLAGFAFVFAALRQVQPEAPTFVLLEITPQPMQIEEPRTEELCPSPEMALQQEPSPEELVLDDVLASLDPGARVVQLFRPPAIPTAGELKANIDRHLRQGHRPAAPPDASDALHDALAELRRSLR